MTQEQKEILSRDLCLRLPYGVKVLYENEIFNVEYVSPMYYEIKLDIPETCTIDISEVKPYLFPFSSMTKEQMKQFNETLIGTENLGWSNETFNWLLKNHFDIYDLIPMGLANDATGLNIY